MTARRAPPYTGKPPYRRLPDREGPIPKANQTVQVARSLSADEDRVLAEVRHWAKLGRSSTATATFPLSEMLDDAHGWQPPNIRLCRGGRTLAWWKVCALYWAAVHRDMLADLRSLLQAVEGVEIDDDLSLARGLALADALIKAISGRERKFVRERRLDEPRPDEIEEPQQEAG